MFQFPELNHVGLIKGSRRRVDMLPSQGSAAAANPDANSLERLPRPYSPRVQCTTCRKENCGRHGWR